MIIFDEKLSDILDDGNARRGWWMELKREEDELRSRMYDYIQSITRDIDRVAA